MAVALIACLAPAAGYAQQQPAQQHPQTSNPAASNPAASSPGASSAGDAGDKSGVYEQLNLFGEAFERIRHDAVDPVPDQRLVRTAIAGMLASLDPHSVYLNEAEYQAMQARTAKQSGSIGLVVTQKDQQVTVIAPRAGSPAASADIKPGDMIFSIDKEPTFDLTLPEVEQKLAGPPGSTVKLLLRRGEDKPITVEVKRAADNFPTVTHRLQSGDIGYIRLAGFDDGTPQALSAAVKDLQQQSGNKLIGFILDLRNDPGGKFEAAVKSADDFLEKGDIAIVKSRKGDGVKHIAATPGDVAKGQPIVALINGGTAGEAELVTAALHDNHRAVLLGSKTFGESALETVIPLNGNGAIRLTTARFLGPSGAEIEGKGIEPDLKVSALKIEKVADVDRIREADLHGALKNPDGASLGEPGGKGPANKAPDKDSKAAVPATGTHPTVASEDIGTGSDEQLSEAVDVLRGLALSSGRTASIAR
jgi:carboxyl-terminal processing protease